MPEKDTLTKNFLEQEELIKAIQANDEIVLKNLYQENYYKTEKYIVDNNGDIAQAKDTYQEAFIAVWENVQNNKFTPMNQTALNGYIYSVAKNKWLNYLKSSAYKKTKKLDAHEYKIQNKPEEISAEFDEENASKLELVVTNFNTIDEACKKLLEVFYYENKSLREIAAELKITEASARNKKYRCLEKLRTLVQTSN
ncbi:RNA polymerase sigma factor [Cellulophaga tyrosinoxydans]|uniref:RNA polymerase sigma factor, sigma-70 family n=1 Tax=Cellulophaga tyrosinoxydans TaxID=504486 RepID=A0A1W1YZV8_9FLAO|nr:sigma-70 family RNA polymerase sigma factor [Cellulophaga tyrosinoxydans]SMC41666.1 RNA polymerase sigma factor, sigma-70 family [Cellulophaga tyrosinoxydans]